jgi:hypothetical protein
LEGRLHGAAGAGHTAHLAEPFTPLRVPKLFNLRTDPFERADITSNTYYDWMIRRVFLIFYANAITANFLESFKEFPPGRNRQPSASTSHRELSRSFRLIDVDLQLPSWRDGPTRSAITDSSGG